VFTGGRHLLEHRQILMNWIVVFVADEDADYDNVQGKVTVSADTNNIGTVANAEVGSAAHHRQLEVTAADTTSATTRTQPNSTKEKKEKKKMFSWGQKKKKKPRTAAGMQCWAVRL